VETRNIEYCIATSKESDYRVDAARWELAALIKRISELETPAVALVRCVHCDALLETDVHCDNCGSFHPTRRTPA
jgi:hypothetical protein